MVLRKVKSAPANICEMVNRKKINVISEKPVFPLFDIKTEEISKLNNKEINSPNKNKKKSAKFIGNVLTEIILEDKNPSSDEYLVLNFVIPFLGGNIISKNFIKNLYNSLITYLVKTFVIYIYHQINQNNIQLIEHYLHMDEIINIIINKETPI